MDTERGIFYLTRQVEFSAAHRLYQEGLSESENYRIFGRCANPYGHGHNYILEVTLRGHREESTGMVVHFDFIKRILQEIVVNPLDHRHLNYDVEMMRGILPTSENLLMVLWETLAGALTGTHFSLYKLRLKSSPRNWVEYQGKG